MLRPAIFVLAIIAPALAHAERDDFEFTSYVGFSLGPASEAQGSLGERLVRDEQHDYVAGRFLLGASVNRVGFELFLAASRMIDAGAMDPRDRDRSAFAWGLSSRYALVHHRYFLLAARAGFVHGSLAGEEVVVSRPSCDPGAPCPPATTYTPPSYGLLGLTTGVRLQVQARPENGLIAAFVDLDVSPVRITFPGDTRYGLLHTIVFGISFGSALN